MRRKGEISPDAIRRDFPYSVWLPEQLATDMLRGARFYASAASRATVEHVDGQRWVAVWFGEEHDAQAFHRHAGGSMGRPSPDRACDVVRR
ncbi:hypothetical protein NVS89_22345 [Ancylobacter sp. MQZ15Z-1]|uniref:Uncharacterized protein n=1 Tax=Ancylobacter mangrovi TaxID=2972472 RepID=A0A9X2PKN9_9HYPH|nr:hypothetical protein [Ancylobacter mangrovi]MCS0497835.1 hypothetical protein [Ancylobacter mangrovi]